jgi:hypothetical protein
MRRRVRIAEVRITDVANHCRPDVSPTVAAEFLDLDERAMKHFIDIGALPWFWKGRRKRITLAALITFKAARDAATGFAGSAVSCGTAKVIQGPESLEDGEFSGLGCS